MLYYTLVYYVIYRDYKGWYYTSPQCLAGHVRAGRGVERLGPAGSARSGSGLRSYSEPQKVGTWL